MFKGIHVVQKCKHPFSRLVVEKEHTEESIDSDFNDITYYLYCTKCRTSLNLSHAKLKHGVENFLASNKY
jgi:hypothetical protein